MSSHEYNAQLDVSIRIDTVDVDKKIYKTIHGDILVSSC